MLIDIGLNLTSGRYHGDQAEVLARGHKAGVAACILTGTNLAESTTAIALAAQYPHCYATVGVHPHEASSLTPAITEQLATLLQTPKAVAVGETGLDFNRMYSSQADQEQAFIAHIGLARATALPLFLHERDASQRLYTLLKSHQQDWSSGVLHCFTGEREALFAYLDLGLMIGITGWVCDERRGLSLQTLVKEIPADRLLLETDGPYLLPRDLPTPPKNKRNEPMYLPHIAATVARLRGESIDQLAAQTTANAKRLFHLSL